MFVFRVSWTTTNATDESGHSSKVFQRFTPYYRSGSAVEPIIALAWAERNAAAIIEDDYDSEFRFGGRPLDPLCTLDTSGRVIYIGSFSKTLLPSLRLGFIIAPPSLRSAVHKAKFVSDWHAPTLNELVSPWDTAELRPTASKKDWAGFGGAFEIDCGGSPFGCYRAWTRLAHLDSK